MVQQQQHNDALPAFLQTAEGKLSLPALVSLIISAMVCAILLTIAFYVIVVRNIHKYFEVKERVSGQHMSFFQAVETERLATPLRERNSSSSSSSSFSSLVHDEQKKQSQYLAENVEYDEDFENVREIKTPNQTTLISATSSSQLPREEDLYMSSAREITV